MLLFYSSYYVHFHMSLSPFFSNILFITLRYVITFYVSKSEIQTQIFLFGSFFHSASLLLILLNNNLCRTFCFVLCILKLHIHSLMYSFSLFSFYLYVTVNSDFPELIQRGRKNQNSGVLVQSRTASNPWEYL